MRRSKTEKNFKLEYIVCTKDMFMELEKQSLPWTPPRGYNNAFTPLFLEGKALVYINGLDD